MRVDVKKTTVYKFNELSEEAKEKAIEKLYDLNVDSDFWSECVIDEFKEDMRAIGFEVDKVYFSGFWSQGDGACFEGNMIDLRLFLLKHKMGNKFRKFLNNAGDLSINTKHRGHYYHEMCMEVNFNGYSYIPDNVFDNDLIILYFEEWVMKTLIDYARNVYKKLEKKYKYLTSREVIEETIEANEYEFTEDGNIYY